MKWMFFQLVFTGLIFGFSLIAELNWLGNLEDAKSTAREEHKQILLVFSGSDWCRNCILLDHEVFKSPEFQKLAEEKLVLIKADFPRKKKNQVSKTQQGVNSQLAKDFNPEGNFPKVVLMTAGEQILLSAGYRQGQKTEFLDCLSIRLNHD
jgi:thioredoxin-related protein